MRASFWMIGVAAALPAAPSPNEALVGPAPPQNQGLPYTKSGQAEGLAAIRGFIAVCAGSRYAYVNGYKVRLDPANILEGEAVLRNGRVFVPAGFGGVLDLAEVAPPAAPAYLKERWVYSLQYPAAPVPGGVPQADVSGRPYVDLAALASARGYQASQFDRGVLLLSRTPIGVDPGNRRLMDNIVTLFDTPEKLVDPAIAAEHLPRLKAQGQWHEHVAVTPEQMRLLEGPPTEFEAPARSAYDLTGFNAALLGSAPPSPGIYPRLLFSPGDVAAIRERMLSQRAGRLTMELWGILLNRSWWDPGTSDGQIFEKLVAGRLDELEMNQPVPEAFDPREYTFRGQTPGIYNGYVNYNTNSLTSMALYCLLTGDGLRGRQTATAIVNYYRKVEPLLDKILAMSDSEYGTNLHNAKYAETGWRGVRHVAGHMDLGLALDFAGCWMTPEQKDYMRRYIAKVTYGRLDNTQAAPPRLQDGVTLTWFMTNYLAASAIEGLEGCDPEVLAAGRRSAKAFLDWGIDGDGVLFEGNGISTLGLQYQVLSMIIMARRGDNLWGHPHWRNVPAAQAQMMAPNGRATLSSGRHGGGPFSFQVANEFKAFYPDSLAADWILSNHAYPINPMSYTPESRDAVVARTRNYLRLPGPSYPGSAFTGIYDTDWQPVTRQQLGLPLTFSDPTYGLLSAYGDNTPEAAWLCLHARSNQYLGGSFAHADVGLFYFSALGVNWITEASFHTESSGRYHNLVLIDNRGQPQEGVPARGEYLGAIETAAGAFATVDQTRSYSYQWSNQFEFWADNAGPNNTALRTWELETDPFVIAAYRGTQNFKARAWRATYTYTNWIPVLRTPWNPVRYAYRTAGLIRGKRSYALVVDDLRKDDQSHLYQWTAILGPGVSQIRLPGQSGQEVHLIRPADIVDRVPKPGAPMLHVYALPTGQRQAARTDAMSDGPVNRYNERERYNRVTIDTRGADGRFRVLLLPFVMGQERAAVSVDEKTGDVTVAWPDQVDVLKFAVSGEPVTPRSSVRVYRDGREILAIP